MFDNFGFIEWAVIVLFIIGVFTVGKEMYLFFRDRKKK